MSLVIFLLGTLFGFLLSRSGAADYGYIQGMFLFTDFQLYGILGCAVAVGAPGIWLLKRGGKSVLGGPLLVRPKPRHRGNIMGGILFGIGWSLTGMCPGPIVVNLGEGKVYALGALAGVLLGTYLLGWLYPRLRTSLHLPSLDEGTGCG